MKFNIGVLGKSGVKPAGTLAENYRKEFVGETMSKKSNIYTWTTLVFFLLMFMAGFHGVWCVITFHPIRAVLCGVTTLLWAYLFKINLDRFNSVERSSGR